MLAQYVVGADVKLTTIMIAILILGTGAAAQTLRDAGPPAEFPPATYKGKQYVDSRGCVYIRAGIDGNVTWVPRVTRNRKLVCGYEPSLSSADLARGGPAMPVNDAPPIILTLDPAKTPKTEANAGKPVPAAKPEAAPKTPVRTATAKPAKPAKPVATGGAASAGVDLPQNARVVRRHVFEARQNTRNVTVPRGYKPVWTDDRLNPRRAERTLAPTVAVVPPAVPRGYRPVWTDGRLNPQRAAAGQGADDMNRVWTQTVPRTLIRQKAANRAVRLTDDAREGHSPYWTPSVQETRLARISTRSEPQGGHRKAPSPQRPAFVRVADFSDAAKARNLAQVLARQGVPMRLGRSNRSGREIRVVLAGPFVTAAQTDQAVKTLRRAGYSGLRVLNR